MGIQLGHRELLPLVVVPIWTPLRLVLLTRHIAVEAGTGGVGATRNSPTSARLLLLLPVNRLVVCKAGVAFGSSPIVLIERALGLDTMLAPPDGKAQWVSIRRREWVWSFRLLEHRCGFRIEGRCRNYATRRQRQRLVSYVLNDHTPIHATICSGNPRTVFSTYFLRCSAGTMDILPVS
jgi:hypothetical protein